MGEERNPSRLPYYNTRLGMRVSTQIIKAAAYTGEDTSKTNKKEVLLNWSHNEISLIIAASAFGVGVNKADVRHIHHIGAPESLEA